MRSGSSYRCGVSSLMDSVLRDPTDGIGNPEHLRGDLSGCLSRVKVFQTDLFILKKKQVESLYPVEILS